MAFVVWQMELPSKSAVFFVVVVAANGIEFHAEELKT